MDYLNKYASFSRRQTLGTAPWVLALLVLTAKTQLWGAPFSFLQDDIGRLLLLITPVLGLLVSWLVKNEDENLPRAFAYPEAEPLERWMQQAFTSIQFVSLGLGVSAFLFSLWDRANLREFLIITNYAGFLIFLALGSIYYECALGYKRVKERSLKQKDKTLAKHLIFWMVIYLNIALGLATIVVSKSASASPWAFLPTIPTPPSMLILIGGLYVVGMYLAWRHYHENEKRGGPLDKASLIIMQIGAALTFIWALPHFHFYLMADVPVIFFQAYIAVMLIASGITSYYMPQASITQKSLLMAGTRMYTMMLLFLLGAIVLNYLMKNTGLELIYLVGLTTGLIPGVYGVYQKRLEEAGKPIPHK